MNRELAAFKWMFHLGQQATPAKVLRMRAFPKLKENNVRKGFLEDASVPQVGGRLRIVVSCTGGMRRTTAGECRNYWKCVSVRPISCSARSAWNPDAKENTEGREVVMTMRSARCSVLSVTGKRERFCVH